MEDDARSPLELDAVVKRFDESATALAAVRYQLRHLREHRKAEEEAAASINDAAQQVAGFTAEAANVLKGLEDAHMKVAEVLRSGAELLDGSELREIAKGTEANTQSIAEVDSRLTELTATVGALEASIGKEIEGLRKYLQDVHADVKNPVIVKRLF